MKLNAWHRRLWEELLEDIAISLGETDSMRERVYGYSGRLISEGPLPINVSDLISTLSQPANRIIIEAQKEAWEELLEAISTLLIDAESMREMKYGHSGRLISEGSLPVHNSEIIDILTRSSTKKILTQPSTKKIELHPGYCGAHDDEGNFYPKIGMGLYLNPKGGGAISGPDSTCDR